MADVHDHLRARLALVRRQLESVTNRLTDEDLPWAPAPGMRTVGGQLFEILGKEVELMAYARAGGREEWREIADLAGAEATVEGYRNALREARRDTLEFIASQSAEGLDARVRFPTDWWEGLGLPELPMHEVIRSVAMHEWYHTAQLTSYLWARGDDPYA